MTILPLHRWDTGASPTRYCCSFHWFRLPDGRTVGLDVIRTQDTEQLGLRVFLVESNGAIEALNYVLPTADWEPFRTKRPVSLGGPKPTIGRGENWIVGAVKTSGPQIKQISFDLNIEPKSQARSSSELLELELVYLAATDCMRAHTTGWVEIDGVRHEIDSFGPVSVHFGAPLTLVRVRRYSPRSTQPPSTEYSAQFGR